MTSSSSSSSSSTRNPGAVFAFRHAMSNRARALNLASLWRNMARSPRHNTVECRTRMGAQVRCAAFWGEEARRAAGQFGII